jgi:hypothetical protein
MLVFTQGADKDIIVTLSENVTLDEPYYLFVFTHITTKEVISFIKGLSDDLSDFTDRYNKFLVLSSVFEDASIGQYEYAVYEQESDSNTDTSLTTSLLEVGKAELKTDSPYSVTEYSLTTSYIEYGG